MLCVMFITMFGGRPRFVENVANVWQMKNWLGNPEGMTSAGRRGHVVGSVCKLL